MIFTFYKGYGYTIDKIKRKKNDKSRFCRIGTEKW